MKKVELYLRKAVQSVFLRSPRCGLRVLLVPLIALMFTAFVPVVATAGDTGLDRTLACENMAVAKSNAFHGIPGKTADVPDPEAFGRYFKDVRDVYVYVRITPEGWDRATLPWVLQPDNLAELVAQEFKSRLSVDPGREPVQGRNNQRVIAVLEDDQKKPEFSLQLGTREWCQRSALIAIVWVDFRPGFGGPPQHAGHSGEPMAIIQLNMYRPDRNGPILGHGAALAVPLNESNDYLEKTIRHYLSVRTTNPS
jgi:hypothetical protein